MYLHVHPLNQQDKFIFYFNHQGRAIVIYIRNIMIFVNNSYIDVFVCNLQLK